MGYGEVCRGEIEFFSQFVNTTAKKNKSEEKVVVFICFLFDACDAVCKTIKKKKKPQKQKCFIKNQKP